MCSSVTRCCLPGLRLCGEVFYSSALTYFPFHMQELLLLWNDPYKRKSQGSLWFCVTGHLEDTSCFCVGVAKFIVKIPQFPKSKNG